MDPAQMEEFQKRMQAGQQVTKPDEKKADDEKKDDKDKPEAKEPPKDEGPPPVQRPTQPRRPADPGELEVAPDDDGKISFSFKGQPWPSVLEWLADVSRMSLQWEEAPAGYLDLTTRGKYTVDEVRDLINSVLLAKGFTLLRNGEVLIVANLKKLDPSLVPRVTSKELDRRGAHELVKVFFDLDWLVAESAADEFKPLLSPFGKVTALKATNRLDVLDTAGNLRRIRELLAEEQSGSGQQRLIQEFKLRHTRAQEVLETLNTLLGLEQKKQDGPVDPQQAMRMQQQMMMAAQQGGMPPTAAAKKEVSVYLAIDPRKNSILANAPPDKMGVIEQAIRAIDMPQVSGESLLGNVQRMQIYRLSGVSPEALVKVLKELGGLDPTTKLEVDPKKGALIVYAPLVDHVLIQSLVNKLDGTGRKFKVIPLRMLSAEYVAGSIITLMQGPEKSENNSPGRYGYFWGYGDSSRQNKDEVTDKFWVEADIERNRLLLRANEVELAQVQALLTELGEIPPGERNLNTVRIVPAAPDEDSERFLRRLKELWPSVAPNPLEIDTSDRQPAESKTPPRRRPGGRPAAQSPDAPRAKPPAERATDARGAHRDPRYRLAQERGLKRAAPDDDEATEADDEERPGDQDPADVDGHSEAVDEADAEEADSQPVDVPRAAERALPPEARAPVKITMGPQGLVISSSDTEALDRLEDLLLSLMPSRSTHKIFTLEHTYAKDVVLLLKDIFKDDAEKQGNKSLDAFDMLWNGRGSTPQKSRQTLGKRRALSFVADSVTNTILVQGADASQLDEIGKLIEFYDRTEPPNSESVRHTQRVALRYAKAKEVAEVVKDVFRDLLSPNDKALLGNMPPQPPQQRQQPDNFYASMMSYLTEDPGKSAAVPRFKGMLSVGIDERANGVVVSAPQILLTQVLLMVKDLDAAARSTRPVVKLLRVKGPRTSALIQQAITPKKSEANAVEAAGGQASAGQGSSSKPFPGGMRANGQPSTGP